LAHARETSNLTRLLTKERSVLPLLPLRLFTGWVFLTAALSKISSGWLDGGDPLVKVLTGWIKEGRPYSFFVPFLDGTVIPHAATFAKLTAFGELAVGVALLAGLFTRIAAVAGLLLVTTFLLGRGDGFSANPTAPFLFILITIALTNPGLAFGFDAALRGKVPRWLI
jgi:thiosulfate dehydrogenase [quinone] large subunit